MTGEPAAKRQRTEEPTAEDLARVAAALEQVEEVNAELEKADEALAKEVLALERAANRKKAPTFAKRNALLAQVPGFWKRALSNHPLLAASMDEQDELILEHATSLDVEFLDDANGSYKLSLALKENPFVANKTVWKQIVFVEDEEADDEVTASGVEWKDTDEAKEAKEVGATFISWFGSAEGDHDLAEFVKDEVWKHPVQLYMADEDDDEEDDEEGEGEDDEGEEGDDAEE